MKYSMFFLVAVASMLFQDAAKAELSTARAWGKQTIACVVPVNDANERRQLTNYSTTFEAWSVGQKITAEIEKNKALPESIDERQALEGLAFPDSQVDAAQKIGYSLPLFVEMRGPNNGIYVNGEMPYFNVTMYNAGEAMTGSLSIYQPSFKIKDSGLGELSCSLRLEGK